jgi:dTDP-4-amino-4,6-dideoxygalactose transaminase
VTRYDIPFTRLHLTGKELDYLAEALRSAHLSGDGPFARRCETLLQQLTGCTRALLTHSCTGALEMAALLADAGPGDEVIMPSFTFVSTANAFVLRGATPVFVDVEAETFTIDPERVAAAVTPKTRAIVPVHYAGVGCDMRALLDIARGANAMVIEDAAQALLGTHRGQPLGSFGALAALSFHETKNVTAGEGGALLINDQALIDRAEVIREKGTNRTRFFRGQVDKYTWTDVGSSYLPAEVVAAFLLAQLEQAAEITRARAAVWRRYHEALEPLERAGVLERPRSEGNAHMYFIVLPSLAHRTRMIELMKSRSIYAAFHYVPLHSSPAGLRYGRTAGPLTVTDDVSDRLLRLPLWPDLTDAQIELVVDCVSAALV